MNHRSASVKSASAAPARSHSQAPTQLLPATRPDATFKRAADILTPNHNRRHARKEATSSHISGSLVTWLACRRGIDADRIFAARALHCGARKRQPGRSGAPCFFAAGHFAVLTTANSRAIPLTRLARQVRRCFHLFRNRYTAGKRSIKPAQ